MDQSKTIGPLLRSHLASAHPERVTIAMDFFKTSLPCRSHFDMMDAVLVTGLKFVKP